MSTSVQTLDEAPYIDRAFLLEKCTNFVNFQIWPLKSELNPELWLQNFYLGEQEHAHHLLNAFMYYSEQLTNQLFLTAFQNISGLLRPPSSDFKASQESWQRFNQELIVTYVTGEQPSPTDSGQLFSRKARQILEVAEEQIFDPAFALAEAKRFPSRPIVFVDDFVGSGNQFGDTWNRNYQVAGSQYSFRRHATDHPKTLFFYSPAIATSCGLENINKAAPQVVVSAGNVLPPENNAVSAASNVWPKRMAATGPQFIKDVSNRAGIPDLNGKVGDWRGFNKLGLCLAFSHSTPDATLPIFYWEANGWNPLVRRR